MRNRQLLGKWLLIVTCLAMALCLVQRAVMLNHFLQGLEPQIALSADAPSQSNAGESGPSPCQLGAHSLLCAQPLFFDGALPAFAPVEQPVQAPPPRIHLKNCVFRE